MAEKNRQPAIGNQIIVIRCDESPGLAGETATIVEISAVDNGGHPFRVQFDDGGFIWLGRADFIMRG
jgi:hypothetical protein